MNGPSKSTDPTFPRSRYAGIRLWPVPVRSSHALTVAGRPGPGESSKGETNMRNRFIETFPLLVFGIAVVVTAVVMVVGGAAGTVLGGAAAIGAGIVVGSATA